MTAVPARSHGTTLGPVKRLVDHLPDAWWTSLFDETYLLTDGDVVEDDRNTRTDVDLVVAHADVRLHHRVLDLCCGQGRHSLELWRRGHRQVVGVDQSETLLNLAKSRAGQAGAHDLRFLRADARTLPFEDGSFDVVTVLGNSFGYFADASSDRGMLGEVRRVLAADGTLVLDIPDGAHTRRTFLPRSWEWIDAEHLVVRERELSDDGRRLVCREVVVHAGKGVLVDQFYAETLFSRSELLQLLRESGFEQGRFVDFRQVSTRNLDLGMMGARVMVAARPRRAVASIRPSSPHKTLAVIIEGAAPAAPTTGDQAAVQGAKAPAPSDERTWLRAALDGLAGYDGVLLDEPKWVVSQLAELQPERVLHVSLGPSAARTCPTHMASVLEALGVSYAGSGPVALALCSDRDATKSAVSSLGIPVVPSILVPSLDAPDLERRSAALGPSVVVKPNRRDQDVHERSHLLATSPAEVRSCVERLSPGPGANVLVEACLPGPDYRVLLLGPEHDRLEVVVQLDEHGHAVRLDQGVAPTLLRWSRQIATRLGLRDCAGLHFRGGPTGEPYLLEVDPTPSCARQAWAARALEAAGHPPDDFLRLLLAALEDRTSRSSSSPR